jgi:hypothetical protein
MLFSHSVLNYRRVLVLQFRAKFHINEFHEVVMMNPRCTKYGKCSASIPGPFLVSTKKIIILIPPPHLISLVYFRPNQGLFSTAYIIIYYLQLIFWYYDCYFTSSTMWIYFMHFALNPQNLDLWTHIWFTCF